MVTNRIVSLTSIPIQNRSGKNYQRNSERQRMHAAHYIYRQSSYLAQATRRAPTKTGLKVQFHDQTPDLRGFFL